METELIHNKEPVHTEQIQDIIGAPPIWLYRWGISFVLVIALLCIFVSSVINYPEVVKTQLKIRSAFLPDSISFKNPARLIKMLVPNDSRVKKGEDLAIVESSNNKIIIKAPMSGKLTYAGIIHEEQQLAPEQNVFFISSRSDSFYGEMVIPQTEIYKVKPGQTVLFNQQNSGHEKQGILKGKIRYITNDQFKNGQCFAEVDFDPINNNHKVSSFLLRNGIMADAEIITTNATLFHRLVQSLTRGLK
jgi:hypothetical protein